MSKQASFKPSVVEKFFRSLGFVLVYDGSNPNGGRRLFPGQEQYPSAGFVRKYRLHRGPELAELVGNEWSDCWVSFMYRDGRLLDFTMSGKDSNGYKEEEKLAAQNEKPV